jgi:hypothetical protein
MSRMYADENFPLPVVDELRRLGHDIITIQETGKGGQAIPDDKVLALASSEDRILLTLNRKHFIRLHKQNPAHAGIIVCTFDIDFVGQAKRIDEAIKMLSDTSGQLIRVNRPS